MTPEIITIKTGYLQTNCYAVYLSGRNDAVIVDPGFDGKMINKELERRGLKAGAVLLTHGHFDHVGAAKFFKDAGCPIYIHKADAALANSHDELAARLNIAVEKFTPDVLLSGGDKFTQCGIDFTVLHAPGHSAGSVCYLTGNVMLSGDTLFRLSIGRTDFSTGDADAMRRTLAMLFSLKEDYYVYPGHGAPTTLAFEKVNNPYA